MPLIGDEARGAGEEEAGGVALEEGAGAKCSDLLGPAPQAG